MTLRSSLLRGSFRLPSALTLVGALGLVTASAALASIPDGAGVIHACYRPNGSLRVVDTASPDGCHGNETALSWNHRGPAGPAGPPGPAAPRMFASMNADGSLVTSAGVVANPLVTGPAQVGHPNGFYQVGFTHPVDGCVPVASVRTPVGPIQPAFAMVGFSSSTQVSVDIFRPDGTPVSAPFELIVEC